MTPTELVLERLQGVKRTGQGQWQALCPVHDDRQASLSVTEGKEGQALVKCHADCDTADILASIGLSFRELYPQAPRQDPQQERNGKIVATYDYTDETGRMCYQVVRYVPKTFRQRQPDGSGGWSWSMKGIRRVLYRLPAVRAAVERGDTVLIVEGEKDADALAALSLAATCNSGGAGKWLKPYSETLNGANVVILPDNDPPGRKHAQNIARELQVFAASVKVLELPNLPEKGDVSDWLAAGGTPEQLRRLIDSCPVWEDRSELVENRQEFPLTDLGNAERLIAAHGENLRYDVNRGAWLVWNGKRWEYDFTSEIDRLAMKVVRSMYELLKKTGQDEGRKLFDHIKRSESQPRLAAMVKLAAKLPGVTVQAKQLDHDPWLLNCLNGTVDLRSGKHRPHAREDLMTRLCECEYSPAANCPRWLQFLEEVFQSDGEVIAFAKRLAGYLLTADTREESVFILTGKGRNGKSKMVETLRAVLGDYAADTPFTTFIERRSDSATNDLAALVGKRLVTASEGEDTQSFNESLLKQLSGGDSITCRFLHKEFFTYTPTFKVLFSTNEVPRIKSQNIAMKERLKLVPFRQRFYDPDDGRKPVKDDQLLPKLIAEKNGILTWMVAGCLEWRERGLITPKAIRSEVERLFESQDPLSEFIEDRCEVGPGLEVEVKTLWDDYNDWLQRTNRAPAFKTPQWFSKNLTQRDGIDTKRGGKGVRLLTGIALRGDAAYPPEDWMSDASDANLDSGGFAPMKEEIEQEPPDSPNCVIASPEAGEDGLVCACGACRAQVVLTDHKPGVYGYSCEPCGHSGIVTHYDYQRWLERTVHTND